MKLKSWQEKSINAQSTREKQGSHWSERKRERDRA